MKREDQIPSIVFSPTEYIIDIAQDFLYIIYIPLSRVIYARYTTGGAFEIMASHDTSFDIACKMEAYLSWCRPSLHHD